MITLHTVTPADAPEIARIYAPYVETTTVTFEYVPPTAEEFARRISHTLPQYPYLKAVEDGRTIGYAYASSLHPRAAYQWATELSVYLDMNCTGRGVGKALYKALMELLLRQGYVVAYGCIALPNEPSIALHQKLGFTLSGTWERSGYKFGKWLDVVWLQKFLCPLPSSPKEPTAFSQLPPEEVSQILSRYTIQ